MSKCQMNKYKPGGRCGSQSQEKEKEKPKAQDKSLAQLIAQRDLQDKQWNQQSQELPKSQLAVIQTPRATKPDDINFILEGDF